MSCSRPMVISSMVAASSEATVLKPKLKDSPLSKDTWWPTIFFPPLEVPSVWRVKLLAWSSFSATCIFVRACPSTQMLIDVWRDGRSSFLSSTPNECLATTWMTVLHFPAETLQSLCSCMTVLWTVSKSVTSLAPKVRLHLLGNVFILFYSRLSRSLYLLQPRF